MQNMYNKLGKLKMRNNVIKIIALMICVSMLISFTACNRPKDIDSDIESSITGSDSDSSNESSGSETGSGNSSDETSGDDESSDSKDSSSTGEGSSDSGNNSSTSSSSYSGVTPTPTKAPSGNTTPTPTKGVSNPNATAQFGAVKMSDFLGFVGTAEAAYQFNPGQEKILEMAQIAEDFGSKIFKTTIHYGRTKFGHTELVQTAKHELFRELFNMDFDTYVLTSHPFLGGNTGKWTFGIDQKMAKEIRDEVYNLTKYLLTEYKNTGKTFILQNWEADEYIKLRNLTKEQQEVSTKAFIDWTNLIQDGVTLAREEVGMQGVWVMFAIETNHLPAPGFRTWSYPVLMNVAFPYTNADLYSGSVWGSTKKGEFTKSALDYYKTKAPDSFLYGSKNIYYGEFGTGESDLVAGRRLVYDNTTGNQKLAEEKSEMEAAIKWGVQFVCYWQIYCNGLTPGITLAEGQNARNDQLRGVWLIRADGTKTPTYHYFKDLLSKNETINHPQRVVSLRNFKPGEKTSNRRPTNLSEFPEKIGNDVTGALIVDSESSGFSTTGEWAPSYTLQFEGKNTYFTREFNGSATFAPSLTKAGKYDVYVYNAYVDQNFDNAASKITIRYGGKVTEHIFESQKEIRNDWIKVGTFDFTRSGVENVSITKIVNDSKVTRAAAVAFMPVD